jgi:hypothetical protein
MRGPQIELTKVTVPVFAINGELDRPHYKTTRMARELFNFTSVVLPGKSHVTAIPAATIPRGSHHVTMVPAPMRAAAFWKAVTLDHSNSNFLESLIALLEEHGIRYCVIGGQAVNAYVEPLVSLDLDLVIAVEQLTQAEALLKSRYEVERFSHSLNISAAGSELRVQLQTDPRYFEFVTRATGRDVLGIALPVASLEDVLQGKVWAASDPAPPASMPASKRRKDLLDIERIVEGYPHLRERVPKDILSRLD